MRGEEKGVTRKTKNVWYEISITKRRTYFRKWACDGFNGKRIHILGDELVMVLREKEEIMK